MRKNRKIIFLATVLAAIAVMLRAPASVRAQDSTGDDPPGRVARLNLVQGSVSFQPAGGGTNDWVAAEVNRPLTTGDQLWSDSDGLVEMHVGSTAVRLDHNTGASYLNLSDNMIQLQVSAGTVIVHIAELDSNDAFELDAPNLAFSLLEPGTYEITVDPNQDVTAVTVVSGLGQVTGGGRSWNITPDQQATFTGSDTLDYSLADADSLPQSSFQQWSAQRDQMEEQAAADQYVSPEMTGSEDLDSYGDWNSDAQYGAVWFPRGVAYGWAPYRFGHWIWIAPWGWSWVDYEPWGFAPFHYGRWAVFGNRWGWVPGPYVRGERPIYAPALVAWVGGAPGFSFSVAIGGGGGIGWFPLGPREVFMPTYRVSEAYVTRVNITNTRVDRNTVIDVYHNNARNVTYQNQRADGGVTVVSHDTFVNGGDVSRNVVKVSGRDVASAPVDRGGPSAEPNHASMVGNSRPAEARPPEEVANRTAVAVHQPPSQSQGYRGNGARNGSGGGASTNQPSSQPETQPANRNMNGSGGNEAPPANGGGRGNNGANGRENQPSNPPPNEQPAAQPNPPAENTPPADNGRNNVRGNGRNNTPNNPPANEQPAAQPNPPAENPPPADNNRGNGRNNTPNNPPANERPAATPPPPPPPQPKAPNVREAPPVRQPTPQEQQSDNQKQQQWQAEHQQVHQNDQPSGGQKGGSGGGSNGSSGAGQNGNSNGGKNPKPPHS